MLALKTRTPSRLWLSSLFTAILLAHGAVAAQPEGATLEEPQAHTTDELSSNGSPASPDSGATGADAKHRLQWRWSRFNAADYAFTATAGLAYFYIELYTDTPAEPRWTGGILFDDKLRDLLVADSRDGREQAGKVSNFFTLAPQAHALIDAAIVPLLFDDLNLDAAWQMSLINLQALAVTGILTRGGHRLAARERPDVGPCEEDGAYHELCFGGSNAGFPSGHTSGAFVGAGLVCAHHQHLPLYGHPVADIGACATSTAMATSSAVLRLVADRHYISDVIAGIAIGAGAGYGLPLLLHYRPQSASQRVSWTLTPVTSPQVLGVAAVGLF